HRREASARQDADTPERAGRKRKPPRARRAVSGARAPTRQAYSINAKVRSKQGPPDAYPNSSGSRTWSCRRQPALNIAISPRLSLVNDTTPASSETVLPIQAGWTSKGHIWQRRRVGHV